jgi:hypothetical protein
VINSYGQPTGILVDTRATIPSTNTLLLIKNNKLGKNAVLKGEHIIVMKSFNTYEAGNEICNNTQQSGATAVTYVAPGIVWTNCGTGAVSAALPVSNEVSSTNNVSLQLYPNPASDVIRIKFTSAGTGNMKARIFDVQGKLVQSIDLEKQGMVFEKAINISSLRPGQYLLRLEQANGKPMVEKFMKQ